MVMDNETKKRKAIKENNNHVFERMLRGEKQLTVIDSEATWWAPRPIIKKDKNALNFILRKGE
jgi:hypothetical protein